jgi:hypothetical protein
MALVASTPSVLELGAIPSSPGTVVERPLVLLNRSEQPIKVRVSCDLPEVLFHVKDSIQVRCLGLLQLDSLC